MITVTKLHDGARFYEHGNRKDPLGALRELDPTVASRYGITHCRVLGFDLEHCEVGTTPDEFVVCANPPELPA